MKENLYHISDISKKLISKKRSSYYFTVIKKSEVDDYESKGWELIPSKLKKSVRMRKQKPHDCYFEDRVWALLAKMQFQFLNKEVFKIEYQKGLKKQIDVFAGEDEAVLFIECKSSEQRKKNCYSKEINELIGIKEDIRIVIHNNFTRDTKVAYIFATNNVVISDNDRKRLSSNNIFHFNQDDIEYFEDLTDHLGHASKYQLFGKLFKGQKIPRLRNRVPAIRGKTPKGQYFYSFSIEPEMLLKMGFILHRSDLSSDVTLAYQRLVKKYRLKVIGKFIDEGGYFPNSIIINIDTKKDRKLRFSEPQKIPHDSSTDLGILYLPQTYKSAFIIDGQHRLYGYSRAQNKSHSTIPVVAFENLPPRDQADIFININHTQKSVPANLLNSIMADFHWKSDNATFAISALKTRLFTSLNNDERSPFYKRIVLSEERQTDKRCLTLKTLRDWGINKVNFFGTIKNNKIIKPGYLTDIDYDSTLKKAFLFFLKCFQKIENELPIQWDKGKAEGGFIAMNVAVTATIRVLENILDFLVIRKKIEPLEMTGEELAENVIPYLESVISFARDLDREGILKLRRLFGSGAPEKVLREFQNAINKEYKEFCPEGLDQWIRDNTGIYNKPGRDLGHKIEEIIDDHVKAGLIKEFGEKDWWKSGVNNTIKIECAAKRINEGSDEPDHNFLNTIHYQKIINQNWNIFGDVFTPPGKERESKTKKLDWMNKFNLIRRKYSHPQRENISEKEYEYLEELHDWISKKIEKFLEASRT
ncbi:MAG: DGQHR domain-containing protein [Candidatus Aminicenantes bacterium]|nr:DGQHR domain-containing protein [Candidatus Aminicenantes bacterium]